MVNKKKNIMSFIFVKSFTKKVVEMINRIWQKVCKRIVKSIVEKEKKYYVIYLRKKFNKKSRQDD